MRLERSSSCLNVITSPEPDMMIAALSGWDLA